MCRIKNGVALEFDTSNNLFSVAFVSTLVPGADTRQISKGTKFDMKNICLETRSPNKFKKKNKAESKR